jgi:hypothetical protein
MQNENQRYKKLTGLNTHSIHERADEYRGKMFSHINKKGNTLLSKLVL